MTVISFYEKKNPYLGVLFYFKNKVSDNSLQEWQFVNELRNPLTGETSMWIPDKQLPTDNLTATLTEQCEENGTDF